MRNKDEYDAMLDYVNYCVTRIIMGVVPLERLGQTLGSLRACIDTWKWEAEEHADADNYG